MRDQGKGSVLNTASLGGVMGLPMAGPYITSKHAVVGMTRTAAIDAAAFGVRVNVICPGGIRTEMLERWTQGSKEAERALANVAPMKRLGEPHEIAETAIWLLSDASSYVTGLVMEVDGGASIGIL
jgi:NAD(P)-dependent dehydrogenase (short-subunit alcohol dehydrogenase family)